MPLAADIIENDESYLVALSYHLSPEDGERIRLIAERLGNLIEAKEPTRG